MNHSVDVRELAEKAARYSHDFFFVEIPCRFGVLPAIQTGNGLEFCNSLFDDLRDRYKIKHRKGVPYRPQTNELVEP